MCSVSRRSGSDSQRLDGVATYVPVIRPETSIENGPLGFEPASRYGMDLPLPGWAPLEAAQVLPLTSFDPGDPTMRGTVIYPPAFEGLEE